MSIQVKLVQAVLTHDTELFSNMVNLISVRTPIAFLPLEDNNTNPASKKQQENDHFGIKNLILEEWTTLSS